MRTNTVQGQALYCVESLHLVHYGASRFDPAKVCPIVDGHWVKPRGGLWTSPKETAFGWKEWCLSEDFGVKSLGKCFELEFHGNVLRIDRKSDLKKLVWVEPTTGWECPLFEPLAFMGVDAIHLTERGQQETRFSHPHSLYGWDCETVLVMNPACVAPITREVPSMEH